jgi:hypothetical protein
MQSADAAARRTFGYRYPEATMKKIALAFVLALVLVGCASESQPSPGSTALSVIGTPFLLAFKIPVCVVSAVVAAPLAGAAELAGTSQAVSLEPSLGDGLERNCGPPYVVAP